MKDVERTQDNADIASNKQKQKVFVKEIIMLLCSFVIFPIISILACVSTDLPVYEVTLSRLAWRFNKLWLVYIWGLFGAIPLIYSIYQTCIVGKYSKRSAWIFAGAGIFAITLMTVGVSIPSNQTDIMKLFHFSLSLLGFVVFFVILWGITFSMCRKNKYAFIISLALDVFLLITGVFMIIKAKQISGNDVSNSNGASALAEVYCFMMYNLISIINYYLLKFIPSKVENKAKNKTEQK